MQFSKLRLTGFKSFVDPTELIIADGLTGVVGPNGCGKSNLLEALRWVMGENRPKAMRGGGMEDVIFAGASSRPARNYAEVSLLIDNTQRLAPAAFNTHDVLEIIRRITRDVGSAYKTNGKDSRAKDVQMLFADASTGAHSPALVRQGQISELINAKPKARRRVLEEAAGISGLYQRRHEAELKLRGSENNLSRVNDVVEQLDSQLGSLARQARQAKRYREIGNELAGNLGAVLAVWGLPHCTAGLALGHGKGRSRRATGGQLSTGVPAFGQGKGPCRQPVFFDTARPEVAYDDCSLADCSLATEYEAVWVFVDACNFDGLDMKREHCLADVACLEAGVFVHVHRHRSNFAISIYILFS